MNSAAERFYELVMRMREAQRNFINTGQNTWRECCNVLEKQVDDKLAEAGYVHKYYRIPSLSGNGYATCEIVKCKLGDQWQLNVARQNSQHGRYSNTQDFPLRNSYLEVKQDIENYFAKLERLKQKQQETAKRVQTRQRGRKPAKLASEQEIFND